jgi:hypothetical protein
MFEYHVLYFISISYLYSCVCVYTREEIILHSIVVQLCISCFFLKENDVCWQGLVSSVFTYNQKMAEPVVIGFPVYSVGNAQ